MRDYQVNGLIRHGNWATDVHQISLIQKGMGENTIVNVDSYYLSDLTLQLGESFSQLMFIAGKDRSSPCAIIEHRHLGPQQRVYADKKGNLPIVPDNPAGNNFRPNDGHDRGRAVQALLITLGRQSRFCQAHSGILSQRRHMTPSAPNAPPVSVPDFRKGSMKYDAALLTTSLYLITGISNV